MNRSALFIDGGYFTNVLKRLDEPRIDYLRLSERVCEGPERLRTYYYNCVPYQSDTPTPEESARSPRDA